MRQLLELALGKGGDYAVYFEQSLFHDIILRDGKVNAAGTNSEGGLGIRVVKDKTPAMLIQNLLLPLTGKKRQKRQPSLQTGCLRQLLRLQSTH